LLHLGLGLLQALVKASNEGAALLQWQGHGGPRRLRDELWRLPRWNARAAQVFDLGRVLHGCRQPQPKGATSGQLGLRILPANAWQ
jgi:hypothetical protein